MIKVASLLCLAAVSTAELVAFHEPKPLASEWQLTGRPASPKAELQLIIKPKLATPGAAEAFTLDRSNPESKNFREWATAAEMREMLRTVDSTVVRAWLESEKVDYTVDQLGHIKFSLPVERAESLFATKVMEIVAPKHRMHWTRATTVHLPSAVAAVVDTVFGLHGMPALPRATSTTSKKSNATRSEDSPNVGPEQIRKLYGVTGRGSGDQKARQAVAEFQGQFANKADLDQFFTQYVPFAHRGDQIVYKYVGNQGSSDGVEALLDIQYIMGIAPGVLTEFWAWKNFDFCSDMLTFTAKILSDEQPPAVFSVSYGFQGQLSMLGCSDSELHSIDANFAAIGGRGISMMISSGDSGSGYTNGAIYASWPASSPWVTAVGATQVNADLNRQSASTQFGSGSGFYSAFPQPTYQKRAVQQYLSKASGLPPPSAFDRNGRGTADVSALGEGYEVIVDGSTEIVGGTSASSPCFAAQISLLNTDALSKGKKTLGFLNPWLYSNPDALTDITVGTDAIMRNGQQAPLGFECAAGWDPATGLGTPIFPKLLSVAN